MIVEGVVVTLIIPEPALSKDCSIDQVLQVVPEIFESRLMNEERLCPEFLLDPLMKHRGVESPFIFPASDTRISPVDVFGN